MWGVQGGGGRMISGKDLLRMGFWCFVALFFLAFFTDQNYHDAFHDFYWYTGGLVAVRFELWRKNND